MQPIFVVSILTGLVVLILLFGAPFKSVRFIGQAAIKLIIGALFLFFLNVVGNHYGIHVPINFVTSAISGFLGIPGLFVLVAIQQWVI
ncbi:pro-sigmaK processing inhibitor BofA family protein [Bacillus rubiinfantis]|uniref:pro-sigmaK processing inhibitor BofA family protein n=1 Tax=Bacillus rubiinfantis TaxID=1499680 RepID=UPI0005A77BB1|nr:pro-sigmaK processing inhibitor BofA family protein [Bacillus rubiinfantis]